MYRCIFAVTCEANISRDATLVITPDCGCDFGAIWVKIRVKAKPAFKKKIKNTTSNDA